MIKSYRARLENGRIVLSSDPTIPEGSILLVTVLDAETAEMLDEADRVALWAKERSAEPRPPVVLKASAAQAAGMPSVSAGASPWPLDLTTTFSPPQPI